MKKENLEKTGREDRKGLSASFVTGAIALAFLVIGYQTALVVHKASLMRLVSKEIAPDTVFVVDRALAESLLGIAASKDENRSGLAEQGKPASEKGYVKSRKNKGKPGVESGWRKDGNYEIKKTARLSKGTAAVKEGLSVKKYETFVFNPNTVSVDELTRLGFSVRQAESIDNYRKKGGRFRRKADFAKSYVVADSVYKRLEAYIDIPKIDINAADSSLFETLPGIGPYFASKMAGYRKRLGGYSFKEQLMDIYRFDEAKFKALEDLITIGASRPFHLWTLPADSLAKHPYIDIYAAQGIVLYRENNGVELWTVEGLAKAGIIKPELAAKLSRCNIAKP